MSEFEIQGERVTLPVEIREAAAWSAMFLVPAAPARSVIGYSGLDVVEPLPGRTILSLAFVRYVDGDLGPYHEFAVAYLVRSPEQARGRFGAFIHWLPVDQSFTLEVGRTIWGFPKEMADIDIAGGRCTVRVDGDPVVDLRTSGGLPAPAAGAGMAIDAYSHLDGTTRRTRWQMRPGAVRARPGGTRITLGDHPVADELRRLGLPKTALCTSTIGRLKMTFQGAEEVLFSRGGG
jgi:hypothetical protein